jgi:hypothetical protein
MRSCRLEIHLYPCPKIRSHLWVQSQEITWAQFQEVGWAQSEEILHLEGSNEDQWLARRSAVYGLPYHRLQNSKLRA